MKKMLSAIFCVGILFAACNTTNSNGSPFKYEAENPDPVLRSLPFSKGVNFSAWFETNSAESIPFIRYGEQDFADVKSLGADVIRLPVRMHSMTNGAPNFTLDPLLLKFLDSAVDWAEKYDLYLIIDNHSFDPIKALADDVDGILVSVWSQIAQRYKNRSDKIIYEILNEPHGISDARWGVVQGMAIAKIREVDPNHDRLIIIGGTDYNSIDKLSSIPIYDDPNLVYTFHYYDPFLFTHQGASWVDPSIVSLAGVPFPAEGKQLPAIPADLKGTWVESSLRRDYARQANLNTMRATLDKVVAFSRQRDARIFCGEFGVYIPNSPPTDRVLWYEIVTEMLDKRNIARTSWDYYGNFGVFKGESGNFNYDLNVGVVRAMKFTPPPQLPRSTEPLSAGFTLYDDYPARDYPVGYWGENVDFSLYDTNSADGDYAIRWGNVDQYNMFWFSFENSGDLSRLLANGYAIEFKARAVNPLSFDIRFQNPESSSSIPWRMRYAITPTLLPADGNWHTIRIPLANMQEQGAWIDAEQKWMEPQGKFSWKDIKLLGFVAEEGRIADRVWIDSIKIVGP